MTVGSYAGVALQDPADTWRHGGIFLLREAPPVTESVSLDGWTTTIVAGDGVVITRGPSSSAITSGPRSRRFEDTLDASLQTANSALDYMAVTGRGDCAIRNGSEDCIVWWRDRGAGGVVLRARIVLTSPLSLKVAMTGTVTDTDGNVVPSEPPPTPLIHEAYRFIRMSRTSGDLYDSYRNMFLALECLLSELRPPQLVSSRRCFGLRRADRRPEGERQWFSHALDAADRLVPLSALTPPGVRNHKRWIMEKMYGGERSALMHAKRGADYRMPQDGSGRSQLIGSLGRLSNYVRELVRTHLRQNSLGGQFASSLLDEAAQTVLRDHLLVISDDPAPLNTNRENPISDDAQTVELQPHPPVAEPKDPQIWTALAHCDPADLSTLKAIRKLGVRSTSQGTPAEVASELVGPLLLGNSVARFEMLHGQRVINRSGPPTIFSS